MVTTMRLPDELHENLKKQAERKGMTFNAYLLNILWKVYKRDDCNTNEQGRSEQNDGI